MEAYVCFLQYREKRHGKSYAAKASKRDMDTKRHKIHVSLLFVDPKRREAQLIHAREPEGVISKTFIDEFKLRHTLTHTDDQRYDIFKVIPSEHARIDRIYTLARSQVGQPYATAEAWCNLWKICWFVACCCPLGFSAADLSTARQDYWAHEGHEHFTVPNKVWTCSELVLVALCAGIDSLICKDPCTYTPDDVYALVRQNSTHFSPADVNVLISKLEVKLTIETQEEKQNGTRTPTASGPAQHHSKKSGRLHPVARRHLKGEPETGVHV